MPLNLESISICAECAARVAAFVLDTQVQGILKRSRPIGCANPVHHDGCCK